MQVIEENNGEVLRSTHAYIHWVKALPLSIQHRTSKRCWQNQSRQTDDDSQGLFIHFEFCWALNNEPSDDSHAKTTYEPMKNAQNNETDDKSACGFSNLLIKGLIQK